MAIERALEGSDGHREAHGRPLEGLEGFSADQHGTTCRNRVEQLESDSMIV